jgi:heme-degrading monooxygenase HmoA
MEILHSELPMIRSMLSLRPKAGGSRDLVRFFEERRIPERALALPGCLGVEVQSLLPHGEEILVTALWTSPASYQEWLDSDGREQDMVHMRPLLADTLDAVGGARLYEIGAYARPRA